MLRLGHRRVRTSASVRRRARPAARCRRDAADRSRRLRATSRRTLRLRTWRSTRRNRRLLALGARGGEELLLGDGTGYVVSDVVRFTRSTARSLFPPARRRSAPTPREIELSGALEFGHAAGEPLVERERLFEVRALDAGAWGNRVMVACREESRRPRQQRRGARRQPAAGARHVLVVAAQLDHQRRARHAARDGRPPTAGRWRRLLKARPVDRATRLVPLDPPGLTAAHITADGTALMAGTNVRVRSREFSLLVMLRQRPDPTAPVRDDNLLDQEVFRQLSMDPRHSRYVERIVGARTRRAPPATMAAAESGAPLGSALRRRVVVRARARRRAGRCTPARSASGPRRWSTCCLPG